MTLQADHASPPRSSATEPAALVSTRHYNSWEFATLEADRLWSQVWQVACREEEVATAGAYVEYEIAGQSVLIVRTADGEVKAYYNACPHRGTRLKKGCGVATEIRCPYHAWSWSLDGSCQQIVDAYDFPGLAPEDIPLAQCQVGTWAGFVFINLSAGAPPLEQFLGPLPELAQRYGIDKYRIASWRQVTLPCNWKTPIDNFVESYHVYGLHPQMLMTTDDVNAVYEPLEIHSIQRLRSGSPSPRLGGTLTEDDIWAAMLEGNENNGSFFGDSSEDAVEFGGALPEELPSGKTIRGMQTQIARAHLNSIGVNHGDLTDEELIDDFAIGLFPNISMHMTYGSSFLFRTRPHGRDPERCVADLIQLALRPDDAPAIAKQVFTDWRSTSWGLTLEQDFAIFEEQTAGLRSHGLPGLRTSAYQEARVRKMHEMVDHYVAQPRR